MSRTHLEFGVGDSRTYRLDADGFSQLTVDHSMVQELIDAGAVTAAEGGPFRSATFSPGRCSRGSTIRPTSGCCRCARATASWCAR
ncbi:MAG TPA: hypothetical protein VKG81_05185, partial [Mycobacterium sp.]|nr:hypothetical protein [Mycobacterium sp.]